MTKAKRTMPGCGEPVWCIFGSNEPWRATVFGDERGRVLVAGKNATIAVPLETVFALESDAWLACVRNTQASIKALQAQEEMQRRGAMKADAKEIEARLRGGAK